MAEEDTEKSVLHRLIEAVSHDHQVALQALSILRLLSASTDCKHTLESNAFLTAVQSTAHETLTIALWRMFDPDAKNAGIVGFCTYAKKHPEECAWLNSADGQSRYPDAQKEVESRADKWLDWRKNLPFTDALMKYRHWYVGHRGLKAWLGKAPDISIKWSEIADALKHTDELVNDFRQLSDGAMIYHQAIYEQVLNDGSFTIASAEAHTRMCIDDFRLSGPFSELKRAILEADEEQIAKNNWVL